MGVEQTAAEQQPQNQDVRKQQSAICVPAWGHALLAGSKKAESGVASAQGNAAGACPRQSKLKHVPRKPMHGADERQATAWGFPRPVETDLCSHLCVLCRSGCSHACLVHKPILEWFAAVVVADLAWIARVACALPVLRGLQAHAAPRTGARRQNQGSDTNLQLKNRREALTATHLGLAEDLEKVLESIAQACPWWGQGPHRLTLTTHRPQTCADMAAGEGESHFLLQQTERQRAMSTANAKGGTVDVNLKAKSCHAVPFDTCTHRNRKSEE